MRNTALRGARPEMMRMNKQITSRVLFNTEPFEEIKTSAVANSLVSSYHSINPGNSALFPWLSNQAHCYKKYKFLSL